jgi:hypothetical protein
MTFNPASCNPLYYRQNTSQFLATAVNANDVVAA